ncbi:MAG: hypothetical protein ABI626_02300 [Sphingomicrobium sp.]
MRGLWVVFGTAVFAPGSALAMGDPALAPFAFAPQPIVVEGQPVDQDKPVCRTERSLGSRVVKRVCQTAAERRKAELDARTNIKLGSGRRGEPTAAFKPPGE